jgi:hypothetical protein
MADEALRELRPRFNKLYAKTGRPSIAPEKLLRAPLLQVLYSVRLVSLYNTCQEVDAPLAALWDLRRRSPAVPAS